MSPEVQVLNLAKAGRDASQKLLSTTGPQRNRALLILADLLEGAHQEIFMANKKDMDLAQAQG